MYNGIYGIDKVVLKLKKNVGNLDDLLNENPVVTIDNIFNPDVFNPDDLFIKNITTKHFRLISIDNDTRNNDYKSVYRILYENKEWGILCWNPFNNFNPDLIVLTIDNYVSYTDDKFDVYVLLLIELDCYENNISYIELCYDTNKNVYNLFNDYYSKVKKGIYYFRTNVKLNKPGEDNKRKRHNKILDIKSENHFYSSGIDGYGKLLKNKNESVEIYNKTLELNNNSEKKTFIEKYFKRNGLDLTKDVYRVELRLTNNSYYSRKRAIDFLSLRNLKTLKDEFKYFYEMMIEFRIIGKNKYVKNMKNQPLIKL